MTLALKLLVALAIFTLATVSSGQRQADAQSPSPYCQLGSGFYNAALCAQFGGSGFSQYCQPGTASYNPTLCAQFGGSTTSAYCQVGTASYNAALCAQFGGSTTSAYCQVGTASYNAALCAQFGGSGSSAYCQVGTPSYSPTLCAQFGGSQAGSILVRANASGLDCGGKAAITASVSTLAGPPITDGTSVLLTATMGTISPTQATTVNGMVQAAFTAPSTGSGLATITASVGSVTNSTNVALNCAPAPAPTAARVAPAAVAPPALVAPASILIQPPSTGDGALVQDQGRRPQWGGMAAVFALMIFSFGAITLRRTHCR